MRKHAIVIAAALALAANIGFVGGQLRAQPDADATQVQSAQASEVRVLRSIDRRLRGIQRTLGTVNTGLWGSLRSELRTGHLLDICRNTSDLVGTAGSLCFID
jgi:hypothetical protein